MSKWSTFGRHVWDYVVRGPVSFLIMVPVFYESLGNDIGIGIS